MVSSICDGFMSCKDDPSSKEDSNKKKTEAEVSSIKHVNIDTATVKVLNVPNIPISVTCPSSSEDIIPSTNSSNKDIIKGLTKVEAAVRDVELAVIDSYGKGPGSMFGSFFKSIGSFLFSPIKTIKGVFDNFVEGIKQPFTNIKKSFSNFVSSITAPFKKIGSFALKALMSPFKLLGNLFGGKKSLNKDSLLIDVLTSQYEEQKEVLAIRHEEIITGLENIEKAIRNDSSLGGVGAVGIGAGIAAALAGAGKLFSSFFGSIKKGLKKMTSPLGSLKKGFTNVKDTFTRIFGKGGSARQLLSRFLKNPFGKLGGLGIAGFIGSEIGKFINDALVPDDVKRSIGDAIGPHIDKVLGFFSGISGFFQEKFEEINPSKVWENLKQNIIDSFSSLADFFNSPFETAKKMFSGEGDKPEVKAEVPNIEEPSVLGFGKYMIDRFSNSFEEGKPVKANLSKQDAELYDLNFDSNAPKAESIESSIQSLDTKKRMFPAIKRDEEMIQNQNKQMMKIIEQQSKANAANYSISTGERGRTLDNTPVVSTDVGLVLVLGGGI